MKKLLILFGLIWALAMPLSAQALVNLGALHINKIISIDDNACAIEIEVLDDGLVLSLGDGIRIDLDLIVDLDLDLGVLHVGDKILCGSPEFEAILGIHVDVEIDALDCHKLKAFVLVRLISNLLNIHVVELPECFTDLTALVWNVIDGTFECLDLDTDSCEVENSNGNTGVVGNDNGGGSGTGGPLSGPTGGAPGDDTGADSFFTGSGEGGCALQAGAAPNALSHVWIWLGALPILLGLRFSRGRR